MLPITEIIAEVKLIQNLFWILVTVEFHRFLHLLQIHRETALDAIGFFVREKKKRDEKSV